MIKYKQSNLITLLQNFYFDGYNYFERLPSSPGGGSSSLNISTNINSSFTESTIFAHPITFRGTPGGGAAQGGYVAVGGLQLLSDATLRLALKTVEKDGLVLYNGGSRGNFFALELVNGILQVRATMACSLHEFL